MSEIKPIPIMLTIQERVRAGRIARLRHGAGVRGRLVPVGPRVFKKDLYGAGSEIAVARYLGTLLDPDWTLAGDKRRGGDIVAPDGRKYHVRSSRSGDGFMWRDWDSTDGRWIFVDTSMYPLCKLVGWLPAERAPVVAEHGKISREYLYRLPEIVFMLGPVMTGS